MAKPVIWTIDDDPDVLRAVERDLRRQYGNRYKVIAAVSGISALDALRQLNRRNEAVALFLVDQRMPRIFGFHLGQRKGLVDCSYREQPAISRRVPGRPVSEIQGRTRRSPETALSSRIETCAGRT
jgi:hypothetical protein